MKDEYRSAGVVAIAAALLMAITMGSRSSFGLFVSSLNTATGLGLITISFAGAVNQLLWGAAQPFVGAIADRWGATRVIAAGGLLLAVATAALPFAHTAAQLVFGFSLIAIAGAAVGSQGLLLGVVSRSVSIERRGLAIGIVGAGGSAGQFVLGPTTQNLIAATGWEGAMFALAMLALLAVPLAWAFRRRATSHTSSVAATSMNTTLHEALTSRHFWFITGGFFVCGFHVSFLIAHMPGVIAMCGLSANVSGYWIALVGLCNIVGSIAAGAAIRRGSMKRALMVLYALRAAGVALFVVLPKTEWMLLAFAGWMGLTYMATLPPTAALVGKLFGLQRMATLIGVVMFMHQVGAFLGVWLGGIAVTMTGGYEWVWYADIALSLLAVAIHMPIREHPVSQTNSTTTQMTPVLSVADKRLQPAPG